MNSLRNYIENNNRHTSELHSPQSVDIFQLLKYATMKGLGIYVHQS